MKGKRLEIGLFVNKTLKVLILVLLFSTFGTNLYSQVETEKTEKATTDISDKIENLAEETDANLDYTEMIESLRYYLENPLNLNYASDEDLKKLIFLNNLQIYNLKAYIATYGEMSSIYELQGIDGFDEETIEKILPFVYVSKEKTKYKITFKKAAKYGRHDLFLRYQRVPQQQAGYAPIDDSAFYENPNSRYLGSPDKIYIRYKYSYFNNIRFGFTAEKDAGEPFLTKNVNDSILSLTEGKLKNGFDYFSFHFHLKDIGHIKALSLGDYQLQFGQGLTMWSALAFGKSADANNVKRFASGLRPYSSVNENLFMRGAAATIGLGRFDVTAFYSDHKIDANVGDIDTITNEVRFITSIQESGLHRTVNEILDKDAISVKLIGGNVTYNGKRIKLGVTGFKTQLGSDLQIGNAPYQRYNFSGSENINGGLDYSYLVKNVNFFGELSMSKNGGFAQIHGLTVSPHPRLLLTLLYRNYSKDFQNIFSNAFSEASRNQNEQGFYTGLGIKLSGKWSMTAYLDNFSFPWLRFGVDSPSKGNEFLVQLNYNMSRKVLMYFRLRQKNKQINKSGEEYGVSPLENTRKNYFRYHIQYAVSNTVVLKNRFEVITYKESDKYRGVGYLLYQDIAWRPHNIPLSVVMRYAIFDGDSYDERIYAYENDVLYAFTVPAYYYKGSRAYFLVKYSISKNLDMWLRFAHTYLANQKTFGSGLEEIDGNQRSEIKVQLRVRF
ncbi:MAG: helix-hairpin-helix domain-containing protein [Chlorobi bacterium]|nr:helix-hairpin-helix domain-containing protein [Chlorobiota bacterium]